MRFSKPEFDLSLKRQITAPSPTFEDFVRQYFLSVIVYTRHEEDPDLPCRLIGVERDVAHAMILSNLPTWHTHLIDAASRLGLHQAVPVLQEMLSGPYGKLPELCIEQFAVERALFRLGGMEYDAFAARCESHVRSGGEFLTSDVLIFVNSYLSPTDARRIIDIGLRRPYYGVRAYAYRAAVALKYIEDHGRAYTEEVQSELWKQEVAAATVGTEQPDFYRQLQYYVGDAIYSDKTEFERRLAELWSKDASTRSVPLFTEINRSRP